jgi:hypothetical protein
MAGAGLGAVALLFCFVGKEKKRGKQRVYLSLRAFFLY